MPVPQCSLLTWEDDGSRGTCHLGGCCHGCVFLMAFALRFKCILHHSGPHVSSQATKIIAWKLPSLTIPSLSHHAHYCLPLLSCHCLPVFLAPQGPSPSAQTFLLSLSANLIPQLSHPGHFSGHFIVLLVSLLYYRNWLPFSFLSVVFNLDLWSFPLAVSRSCPVTIFLSQGVKSLKSPKTLNSSSPWNTISELASYLTLVPKPCPSSDFLGNLTMHPLSHLAILLGIRSLWSVRPQTGLELNPY